MLGHSQARQQRRNLEAMKSYLLRLFDRLADRAIHRQRILQPFGESSLVRPYGDSFNVLDVAFLEAARESADYWRQHMIAARAFNDGRELLTHALGLVKNEGLWLEFGVASGLTISHIANISNKPVFGFDSFEGLPDTWHTGYSAGDFAGPMPKVPTNVTLIKGYFSDTLPDFLRDHPEHVAFLHVDCDLYSSTKCIFDLLQAGCVIVFNEYFNYPAWQDHEHKAFMEFVERRKINFRYDSFVPTHQEVCLVVQ